MAERLFLGIESSCDETAAAVVARDEGGPGRILSNIILSQTEAHAAFGGVVPEIAARAHIDAIEGVIRAALTDADCRLADISAIAATAGPGLIGGVLVGLTTARAMSYASGLPLIAINHLEGHALTPRLTNGTAFPYLLLLVSGGHTQIVLVEDVGRYTRLGTTIDDALGEAFDKTAKLLGLGYPGGPHVEQRARTGNPDRFPLPRPMLHRPEPNFSFSGLKTAVRETIRNLPAPTAQDIDDICASFQAAVSAVIADRIKATLRLFSATDRPKALVVAGGVAANKAIAAQLQATAAELGLTLIVPPGNLCTDNGAMIAWAGAERFACGMLGDQNMPARPRWPLDNRSEPLVGTGRLGAKV